MWTYNIQHCSVADVQQLRVYRAEGSSSVRRSYYPAPVSRLRPRCRQKTLTHDEVGCALLTVKGELYGTTT